MPPKRKSLGVADPNAAPPPKRRGKDNADASSGPSASGPAPQEVPDDVDESVWEFMRESRSRTRSQRWAVVSASKNLDEHYLMVTKNPNHAYEFMCICNPVRSFDEDDEGDENPNGDGPGGAGEKAPACDGGKTCPCEKTAASLPSHIYTMTRAGIAKYLGAGDMMNLRNPDAFAMHTFNDHLAYGALEVVQNLLLDFEEARHLQSWQEAWAVTEAVVVFMVVGEGGNMCMADDGEMIQSTMNQIIRMILSTLAIIEAQGKLTEGSDLKNIGWIMALSMKMAELMRSQNLVEKPQPTKAKTFKFRGGNFELYLQAYARRCNITIPGVSLSPSTDLTMPKLDNKDAWGWVRTFSDYQRGCVPPIYAYRGAYRNKIGGDGLDITTWTSAERKEVNFDKKDPLAGVPIKKIKEGAVFRLG